MNKEYIITVFSENKVGLLSQITTVFTCRDINIESLTTSESSIPGIHKFTIVVITGPEKIEKLVKQIEKKIDVTIISYWKRPDTKRIPSLCSNYYNPMGYSNSSGRAKLRSSNQNANY